jgi:peptide chain release factor 3
MVLDAAKGIEEQTRKLFGLQIVRLTDHHLCQQARPRGPRPVRSFDLLDEIEQGLALDVTPASWPIGMG